MPVLAFFVEFHYGNYYKCQALMVSPVRQLFARAGLYGGTGRGAHVVSLSGELRKPGPCQGQLLKARCGGAQTLGRWNVS